MNDIVQRLKAWTFEFRVPTDDPDVAHGVELAACIKDAAAEIERLRYDIDSIKTAFERLHTREVVPTINGRDADWLSLDCAIRYANTKTDAAGGV